MKILFYVQRLDTAYLTESLAREIRHNLEDVKFAALTYHYKPDSVYLREHASKVFDIIASEGEMHLEAREVQAQPEEIRRIEETYGIPTIWQFVTQNRFLTMRNLAYLFRYGSSYSREQILAHIQHRFQCIEKLLDDFQPDILIYPEVDVGPSSALILERVAKQRGIPVLVPISARVGSYHTFTDTVFSQADHVNKRFKAYSSGELSYDKEKTRALLERFREGKISLSYIDDELKLNRKESRIDILKRALEIRTKHSYFKSGDPFYPSHFAYDMALSIMKFRRMRLGWHNFFEQPKENEKFVYFPLHIEPEIALILYAPFYTDQLSIIRNVAQSLPHDTCLYVKDHVVGQGRRTLSFYRQIAGIPNVRLLDGRLDSRELIKRSQGVVTITGTAGMEAMLFGKPVITYGDVFYNVAERLVFHTHSFEDTPFLVKHFESFQSCENEILAFLAALVDESVDADPLVLAKAIARAEAGQVEASQSFKNYANFMIGKIQDALEPALESSL